jgi:predicted RNA-binding Zn ribbon-like protein
MEQFELIAPGDARALSRQAHERPELASAEHKLVIEMRDDTYDALNDDGQPDMLQRHLASAHASSRLDRMPGGAWTWAPAFVDLAMPRHRLAFEFARLLTSDSLVNFHRCEDRYCGFVFLDTSRQRNRRWCSSAGCGNRNRVRGHYERSRSASPRHRTAS